MVKSVYFLISDTYTERVDAFVEQLNEPSMAIIDPAAILSVAKDAYTATYILNKALKQAKNNKDSIFLNLSGLSVEQRHKYISQFMYNANIKTICISWLAINNARVSYEIFDMEMFLSDKKVA